MENFIDSWINKLKLKRFQVSKIPKMQKPPHFHYDYSDQESKEEWKLCIKENERNTATPTSIRTRLKLYQNNNKSIKSKGGINKQKGVKNLFILIDEESKQINQNNKIQSDFCSGNIF